MSTRINLSLLSVILLFTTGPALAEDFTANTGDYNIPTNWSPVGVPNGTPANIGTNAFPMAHAIANLSPATNPSTIEIGFDNGSHGTLEVNGAGTILSSSGIMRLARGSSIMALLDLNTGAVVNVGSHVIAGRGGSWDIDVDTLSQLNVTGGLEVNGDDGGNPIVLPLDDTATNGRISIGGPLTVGVYRDTSFRIDSTQGSAASMSLSGDLSIAGTSIDGAAVSFVDDKAHSLEINAVDLTMSGNLLMSSAGARGNDATLNVTNSTLTFNGTGYLTNNGAFNTSSNSDIDLIDSTINLGNHLVAGRGGNWTIDLLGTASQVNVGGSMELNGDDGGNPIVMPLDDSATNGRVSLTGGLTIGVIRDTNVLIDSTQGAAPSVSLGGGLLIGGTTIDGAFFQFVDDKTHTLTVNDVDMNFNGSLRMSSDGGRGNDAVLNVTDSTLTYTGPAYLTNHTAFNTPSNSDIDLDDSIINVGGNLIAGRGGDFSIDFLGTTSEFNVSGSMELNGGDGGNPIVIPLDDSATPGRVSLVGGLTVGVFRDTNVLIDSTQGSASSINLSGGLSISANPIDGAFIQFVNDRLMTLSINDVDMTFTGALSMSAPGQRGNDSVLNVTDSTLNFAGGGTFATNIGFFTSTDATVNLDNSTVAMSGNVQMRTPNSASAAVQGTGTFSTAGQLDMNGRLVADGGTLNVSFGSIINNDPLGILQGDGTQAGWYAVNGGNLPLPGLAVSGDTSWGEAPTDASLDLVNSARFQNFVNLTPGTLSGEVLAIDNPGVPFGLVDPIGVWDFSGITFDSAEIVIRYDDALAAALTINEADLKMFHLDGGSWVDITDTIDQVNNTVLSVSITHLSEFAIAVDAIVIPEPSALALALVALFGLAGFGWRRRSEK